MKPNRAIVAGIFAASLATLGAGIAYASPGEGCAAPQMMRGMHNMRGDDMGAMPPHFRRLNLTETQRNQIFDIKYKSMPVLRQYRQQLRATMQAMREATISTQYDAAKLRSFADKMGKLQADIAVQRAADQHKIFAVLTPEQQVLFKQMHDRYMGHGSHDGPGMSPMDMHS